MEEEKIELVVQQESRSGGFSVAVLVSLVFHTILIIYFVTHYKPVTQSDVSTPIVHYVELMRQQGAPAKQFTEAPGPKTKTAPMNAPYSDANRKASMPKPTGEQPTMRPGQGGFYTPPTSKGDGRPKEPAASTRNVQQELMQQPQQSQEAAATPQSSASYPNVDANGRSSSSMQPLRASAQGVDLRRAIQEVGKVASLGTGQTGVDFGNGGGEKGFASDGPLSFETQWYDWGPYAASMVSRIRVNWKEEMPRELLQSGLKGVVTIRFTIHRDGRITDITILNSSTIPPYDFAAKKAIERSSPLNPLPKDFPNETERVTAMFFYNQEPPEGR